MKSRWIARQAALVALAAAAAVVGCNDNELGIERRRPNRPPETILSSSPRDSTYGTVYRVQLFWSGADVDGTIDHYDFIMVDHPAMDSCIECDPNDPRTVVVTPPAADDPRWTSTSGNDTLIVTRADTLRINPQPPDSLDTDSEIANHARLVLMQNFERWHTFFVRAVDNEGQADPTPEYVSFNSTTLAPVVALQPPINPRNDEFRGPRVIVFNWEGEDPIGDGSFVDPIASRWVIIPSRKDATGAYLGYPDSLYQLPRGRQWSIWRRWNSADGSGRRAIVTGLDPVGSSANAGWYLFAVQAMDEAGAVTPVFDSDTAGRNNVAKVFVQDEVGAILAVDERFLGQFTFTSGARPISLAVAAGQPITFRWRADASSYGGTIVAFRYGWNIINPDNDEEWEQNWCETCRAAPTRVFSSNTQRFFVETRDNAGTVTRAEVELVVHQVTRRRDLLFVDDTGNFDDDGLMQEVREDDRWASVIETLIERQPFTFDAVRDVYDVQRTRREPPPISLVFDYKTVVWCAKEAVGTCALRELTQFFDPFVLANQNRVVRFNFLQIYIENQGEMWVSGQQPTNYMWSSFPPGVRPYPFNVTNWDDPIMPHPQEDSVGVRSFLWRMGAEAVDHGGGGQGQGTRDAIQHYCIGFRRSTPQGHERQVFQSSRDEDHQHEVEVLTADVEMPPAAGVTYTTASGPGVTHSHTLTLTEPQLRQLARGDVLADLVTSVSEVPNPHSHTFTLSDQTGLWGAPPSLEPERGVWAQPSDPSLNPLGGRPGVEIYNMPAYLASQSPRLLPDPRVWESLYSYVSPVPADPTNGVLYPQTADAQPAVLLRKANAFESGYSRALCGFELWRLRSDSHLALAEFIMLRHFRLGLPE